MLEKSRSNQRNLSLTCFFYIEEVLSITENGFSKIREKLREKCTKTHVIKYAKVLILLRNGKKQLTCNVESVSF